MTPRGKAVRRAAAFGLVMMKKREHELTAYEDVLAPDAKAELLELREQIDLVERHLEMTE